MLHHGIGSSSVAGSRKFMERKRLQKSLKRFIISRIHPVGDGSGEALFFESIFFVVKRSQAHNIGAPESLDKVQKVAKRLGRAVIATSTLQQPTEFRFEGFLVVHFHQRFRRQQIGSHSTSHIDQYLPSGHSRATNGEPVSGIVAQDEKFATIGRKAFQHVVIEWLNATVGIALYDPEFPARRPAAKFLKTKNVVSPLLRYVANQSFQARLIGPEALSHGVPCKQTDR